MNNSSHFSADVPEPKPIKPEDLLKETEKSLQKTQLTQQITKEVEFRQKVAEHKKKHSCCIYPEICVTAEQLPKDAPIR